MIKTEYGYFYSCWEGEYLSELKYFRNNETGNDCEPMDAREKELEKQLREYMNGERKSFSIPLNPNGTPFQKKVWNELLKIPYGEVRTYGEIAKAVGCPKGARAVGLACNKNPIIILIPCHRVVGKSGRLTGYACGIDVKEKFLSLENAKL
ncbi:hypothetical protein B5F08_04160 [Anaeromassilibacillus sp. An172]|uniref:methylated-DNA--[protein]-cysteine S-methyltransferase n=1 Tax=Anaeromassilibacillus sp. An172 TaxID=1965570 RepID=UPI000B38131F|nr:methylated-DNA--[protein]-cysteine S-methyltransferase [Anaeromassilibacillus sp. An172]OUP79404.1 hypothetical protein B5F08_04160 [Anaeromassilibacillus sp. An172]